MEDITKVQGTYQAIQIAGLVSSLFCRKDPKVLSRTHCEVVMLVERNVPINWGAITKKSLEEEFLFAMKHKGTMGHDSTRIGPWMIQFLTCYFARRCGNPIAYSNMHY